MHGDSRGSWGVSTSRDEMRQGKSIAQACQAQQSTALLRHLLTFIGGTLVAKGILDTATLTEIIGSVLTLLSVGWMALDKSKGEPSK